MRRGTLILTLGCGWLACATALAQTGVTQMGTPAGRPHPTQPPPLPPPPLPTPKSPIDALRRLLKMSPAEREVALAQKPEKQRQYLQQRLLEMDALSPTEKETRLRLLQVRYYLLPLMKLPATNRNEPLKLVPPAEQKLIAERLQDWDRLPPEHQRELLLNENTLRYFPRFETNSPSQQAALLAGMSEDRRQKLEEDLARWQAYSEGQRQRMYLQFERFFASTDRQRERTLQSLAEADRRQTKELLAALEKVPPERQARCLEAFWRFTSMSPAERSRFLANAALWESMTADERRVWREYVAQMPPSPPGLLPGPVLPPLPPSSASRKPIPTSAMVTNR